MNLNTLSEESGRTTGSIAGFVIKSLAHPDRRFRVEAKLSNGKFAITRLDTGASYFVLGSEDRYEFAMPMTRIREVKQEIAELDEQAATIAARLSELKIELSDFAVCDVG